MHAPNAPCAQQGRGHGEWAAVVTRGVDDVMTPKSPKFSELLELWRRRAQVKTNPFLVLHCYRENALPATATKRKFCLSASLPLQHTLLVLLWLFSDEMYYIEALAYVQAACYPATPQEQRRRLCRCSTSPSQQASSESRGWRRQRSLLGQLRCVCRGPVHVCAASMLMLVEICGHAPCQVLDHDIPVC